jgi:hypothetical protein
MMMTVFMIKYVLAVTLAIQPQMAGDVVFAATVCGLLGLCNGYFLGQLARDIAASRRILQANGVPSGVVDPV